MWPLSVPWWEFVLRGVIVYGALLVLLRLTGKRQVGEMAPFDLVLLLVLSNAVQNAMNAGDNSVTAGLLLAGTLITLNYLLGLATFKSRRLEAVIEGRPEIIIHHGTLVDEVLKREQITPEELHAALRAAGCASVDDVRLGVLETNGRISVIPRKSHDTGESGNQPPL